MRTFSFTGLKSPMTSFRKHIAIESKVEQVVEEDRDAMEREWRTKLGPKVSVTISRGEESVVRNGATRGHTTSQPTWRINLSYLSFLLLSITTSSLKLPLAPLNAILSNEFGVSYLPIAALTSVPLLLGSFSSLGSAILGRSIGRRAILVIGTMFMLVGVIWNWRIDGEYAEFVAARAFQGVGWGAVEGVLSDSVEGLFSTQVKPFRMSILYFTTSIVTWSTPILSGYLSYSRGGWREIFMVISILQILSFFMVLMFSPETQINTPQATTDTTKGGSDVRNSLDQTTTSTIISSNTSPPRHPSAFKSYVQSLRFLRPLVSQKATFLAPLKALRTPSAIISTLLIAPVAASSVGIAQSLALLFSIAPTFLQSDRIGYLFILPASFILVLHSILMIISYITTRHSATSSLPTRNPYGASISSNPLPQPSNSTTGQSQRSRTFYLALLGSALLLGAGGVLGVGVYTCAKLSPRLVETSSATWYTVASASLMNEERLWFVSALFGGAVVGAAGVTRFVGLVSEADGKTTSVRSHGRIEDEQAERELKDEVRCLVNGATAFYTALLSGIFAITFPIWVSSDDHPIPSSSTASSGPVARHVDSSSPFSSSNGTSSTTAAAPQQLGADMIMGIQMTSVALGIVILVVGGVASVALVFGKEGLGRRDARCVGLLSEGDKRRGKRGEEEVLELENVISR